MKRACEQSARFRESLGPFAPAVFNISWAGEKQSLNWFHTARELSERWHHQQQIRLATTGPAFWSLNYIIWCSTVLCKGYPISIAMLRHHAGP